MDAYIGQIIIFAGNFAPKGWAMCNGQLMSIQQNAALFSILGTYYGGNGTSTFGLPDLRGRAPISMGQGPGLPDYALGEMGGVNNVSLTLAQMPAHTHTFNADANSAATTDPTNAYMGNIGAGNTPAIYSTNNPNVAMGAQSIAPAGGNLPVSIMQPYLAVNYIICLAGIFPSRN